MIPAQQTNAMQQVTIYTDGACRGNPGPGGWAAILMYRDSRRELSGSARTTTNNRMELTAAIEALQALKRPCVVELFTDSEYVRQGIQSWLPRWKKSGFRTADRRPVKNQDLWEKLELAASRHEVHWRWIRGHAGDPMNELCDRLAKRALENGLKVADAEGAVPALREELAAEDGFVEAEVDPASRRTVGRAKPARGVRRK